MLLVAFDVLFIVFCLLFVVCLFVVSCSLFDVRRWLLAGVCCLLYESLFVVRVLLFVDCGTMLVVLCLMIFVRCSSFVVR